MLALNQPSNLHLRQANVPNDGRLHVDPNLYDVARGGVSVLPTRPVDSHRSIVGFPWP
jgi:hypothetical protein